MLEYFHENNKNKRCYVAIANYYERQKQTESADFLGTQFVVFVVSLKGISAWIDGVSGKALDMHRPSAILSAIQGISRAHGLIRLMTTSQQC